MEKEKLFCILQILDDLTYSSVTFLLLLFKGLLGVCPKEERHLVVPADLAYGERGAGEVIPPNATLLFDIVVMDVEKVQKFVKTQQYFFCMKHPRTFIISELAGIKLRYDCKASCFSEQNSYRNSDKNCCEFPQKSRLLFADKKTDGQGILF